MSQTDVQNLVILLSNNQADQSLFTQLYDDVMAMLGPGNWHSIAVPVTYTANTTTVNLPSNLLNIIEETYDGTVLSDLNLREMESLKVGWRSGTGTPIAFTRESETVKTMEVFPPPFQTTTSALSLSIHSELRTIELPYLTLYMALKIMEREYDRESDHADPMVAEACHTLADTLLAMLT